MRTDGRKPDQLRPISLQRNYTCHAPGSVLIEMGRTKVLCTAMLQNRVPKHCLDEAKGWLTAEYCMLPSANADRRSLRDYPAGRDQEIQRLIGRSLRGALDLHAFPRRTIWIDCNVIQADGGTRTASITGGFVALLDALWHMRDEEIFEQVPLLRGVCALSVGIVDGRPMLDLCAEEDMTASVDMNVVLSHEGKFIEVQGTAEREPFDREQHAQMLDLVLAGAEKVKQAQADALGGRLEELLG